MKLENIHISFIDSLVTPQKLKETVPLKKHLTTHIYESRRAIQRVLIGSDHRMLAIVGPCSIHDPDAAYEYAKKLQALTQEVHDQFLVIMRVYFEKPRTTVGWRGLIIDPEMDNSNNINLGLRMAREIMVAINEVGLPIGTEFLDPIVPNYIDDLVGWASIGARTIESQTHRDMASGISVPVGFKNSTSGDIENAINAMVLSSTARGFIGTNKKGQLCIVHTTGNPYTHLILRGGRTGPNYFPENVAESEKGLREAGVPAKIIVDCSHGNSLKNPANQPRVLESVINQRMAGDKTIVGFMMESNIMAGSQKIKDGRNNLEYGVSVTDACLDFEHTADTLIKAHSRLRAIGFS